MKQETKSEPFIRVLLNKPHNGKREYYFGSLAAIYSLLSPDIVGITLTKLWSKKLRPGKFTITPNAVISKLTLHRKCQHNKPA